MPTTSSLKHLRVLVGCPHHAHMHWNVRFHIAVQLTAFPFGVHSPTPLFLPTPLSISALYMAHFCSSFKSHFRAHLQGPDSPNTILQIWGTLDACCSPQCTINTLVSYWSGSYFFFIDLSLIFERYLLILTVIAL